MDPTSVCIQGDLSRNDVIQLCRYCSGKDVVEFGMGGSTLILARCCKSLTSYDTDPQWYARTAHRIAQIPDKTCEPKLELITDTPTDIPSCDVLWIDGRADLRKSWWDTFFDKAPVIIAHDSRRPADAKQALDAVADNFHKVSATHLHVGNSNLVVVEKHKKPRLLEDWKAIEAQDNRASVLEENYVCRE